MTRAQHGITGRGAAGQGDAGQGAAGRGDAGQGAAGRRDDARPCWRILDANLNRASEGLRVVEDICRLHWSLVGFAAELKEARHRLYALVDALPGSRAARFGARDIEGDVGRDLVAVDRADAVRDAVDPGEIAYRNLRRASEAIRVLEETSRAEDVTTRRELQSLRYAIYALEKALAMLGDAPVAASARRERLARARVYLLATVALARGELVPTVECALGAGVDIVQLREKALGGAALLGLARTLRELTARHGALFIVNDRPDIAHLVAADGVHLGQDDLPVAAARVIVGDAALVGVSTHSVADARRAARPGADYIGVGPMFPTATKDAGAPFGPGGLASVLAEVAIPAFAIGGISPANAGELRAVGALRVAASAAILSSDDPAGAVAALRAALGVDPHGVIEDAS